MRAPYLYALEAGERHDTRGIVITSLTEVGGSRSAGKASPLTWRRLPK
jgi:hypothetical protein